MGENSSIEWTDHTFNAWIGCSKVHPGCANCYAEADFDKRKHWAKWGPNGTRVMTSDANWEKPKAWNKAAQASGVRFRVFCESLSDVFEDWSGGVSSARFINGRVITDEVWVTPEGEFRRHSSPAAAEILERQGMRPARLDDVRRRLFALIDATPYLDWLLLTKRPENVRRMWPQPINAHSFGCDEQLIRLNQLSRVYSRWQVADKAGARPNVWLGTSVSDQASADKQIPELLKCRDLSPVLFLSIEPLLGPVNLTRLDGGRMRQHWNVLDGSYWQEMWDGGGGMVSRSPHRIDWCIVGGESGHGARPMHPDWVRSIRNQCQAAGVPFFFKQGSQANWSRFKDAESFPEDLRIREFPEAHYGER